MIFLTCFIWKKFKIPVFQRYKVQGRIENGVKECVVIVTQAHFHVRIHKATGLSSVLCKLKQLPDI